MSKNTGVSVVKFQLSSSTINHDIGLSVVVVTAGSDRYYMLTFIWHIYFHFPPLFLNFLPWEFGNVWNDLTLYS